MRSAPSRHRTTGERMRMARTSQFEAAIMKVSLGTGRRERVAPFETGLWYGLALSPDERTLLGVLTTGGTDVMFVEPNK